MKHIKKMKIDKGRILSVYRREFSNIDNYHTRKPNELIEYENLISAAGIHLVSLARHLECLETKSHPYPFCRKVLATVQILYDSYSDVYCEVFRTGQLQEREVREEINKQMKNLSTLQELFNDGIDLLPSIEDEETRNELTNSLKSVSELLTHVNRSFSSKWYCFFL